MLMFVGNRLTLHWLRLQALSAAGGGVGVGADGLQVVAEDADEEDVC